MCGELPSAVPPVRVHTTEPLAIASLNVYPTAVVLTMELVDGLTEVNAGGVVSITIVLLENIFAPDGTVVLVMALPAKSATVPIVKLETAKEAVLFPAATVYVPTMVVPLDAAVKATVVLVVLFRVTVIEFPDTTDSFVLAVITMSSPAL